MPTIGTLKTWTAEVLTHTDLNGNFSEVRSKVNAYGAWLDQAQTFTAIQTFSATPVFSSGVTVSVGTTAVQALTSTAVTVSGENALTFSNAAAKVVPGATSLTFRNNANNADNIAITDAGAVTVRAGLTATTGGITATAGGVTVTAGDLTVTAGNAIITAGYLQFGASAAVMRIGATSLAVKTNDGATQLAIWQANSLQITSPLSVSAAGGGSAGLQIGLAGSPHVVASAGTGGYIQLGGAALATSDWGTTATQGFPMIPSCNGTPTGVLANGRGSLMYDYANNILYIHSGSAWRSIATA